MYSSYYSRKLYMPNYVPFKSFYSARLGILQTTLGNYDISPWSQLKLDAVDTFMDYYTVIVSNQALLSYSVTYGMEPSPVGAICQYGKGVLGFYLP